MKDKHLAIKENIKLNNNQLIAVIIGLGLAIAFILGITTISVSQILTVSSRLKLENAKLKAENANLKIEVDGLMRLMELKDQDICHYSHREVAHNFRVINKR